MKASTKPLALLPALIVVSLLLSWKYFDDNGSRASPSGKDWLTDEELIAWMADNAGGVQDDDQPPAAEDVLVQRIPGDNNHLLMMAYYFKENYSKPSFTIENGYSITFRDDGRGEDQAAGDGLYTAKITADAKAFRKEAVTMLQQMRANGYKPVRYINRQRVVDPNAAEGFEAEQFDRNEPVSISGITNALSEDFTSSSSTTSSTTRSSSASAQAAATPTTLDSLRKNSILITNLGVVEDHKRTWNYCSQNGNVNGVWTFGTLMRQLASKDTEHIATDAQLSDFVKKWLNSWAVTQVINGDTVKVRPLVNTVILDPWLTKSQNAGAPAGQLDMRFAPFKLTAIVNRFDLRTGKKFGLPEHPCGEGRFVFCLIKSDCSDPAEYTVIFEYGINKPNTCEAQRAWAQKWFDLKNFPIGSPEYNQALQSITSQFVKCGTNSSKPNQSSLDQIRTNEVIQSSTNPKIWEFREFILDSATGQLKETTVAQNPADKYNAKQANADVQRMVTYVNNHSGAINKQINVVPLTIQKQPFLGGSSRVNGEATGNPPGVYYWDGTDSGNKSTFITNNDTRFNFSLQTCAGCHAGETQTGFTHIDPAFFKEEAGLSGFLTGKAGRDSAIDFDGDSNNDLMSVKDAALRPSPANATIRSFNDIKARATGLKAFLSKACGTPLAISSQLMFQPITMVH